MRPWLQKEKKGYLVRWRDFHGSKQSSALLPDEIQARRFAQMISNNLSQQYSLESTLIKSSTVRDTAEMWLTATPCRKEATREHHRIVIVNFLRQLGDRNLASLRPVDLSRYLNHRIKEVSQNTYSHEIQYIRKMFAFAQENLLIAVDPAKSFRAPWPHPEKHQCLTWREEHQLLSVLEKLNPKFLPRILLCRDTGMRMANAHRLERRNLSFDPPSVRFTVLKSDINLTLPLTRRLTRSLRQFEALAPESLLFPYKAIREGRNYTGASVFNLWLNKKLDFKVTFHDLRYTFRARFKDASGDRELAEYCLGHSMSREIKSYYWTAPTPEKLADIFREFDDYQEDALSKISITKTSDAEMWAELKTMKGEN